MDSEGSQLRRQLALQCPCEDHSALGEGWEGAGCTTAHPHRGTSGVFSLQILEKCRGPRTHPNPPKLS
jgi:hypothetical protein